MTFPMFSILSVLSDHTVITDHRVTDHTDTGRGGEKPPNWQHPITSFFRNSREESSKNRKPYSLDRQPPITDFLTNIKAREEETSCCDNDLEQRKEDKLDILEVTMAEADADHRPPVEYK